MDADDSPPRPSPAPSEAQERAPWLRRRISWAERKKILYREAWIAAISLQLLLAAAWAAPTGGLGDGTAWILLFWVALVLRMLTWHIAGLVAVVLLSSLAVRKWRLALASAPAGGLFLVLCAGAVGSGDPPPVEGARLKVMSVNLLMVNRDTQPTIDEIRREDPDVISFQEYALHWDKALRAALGERYPYEVHDCREDSFGGAIYSRIPLKNAGTDLSLGSGEAPGIGFIDVPAFRAEFTHEGATWVLYNVHMLPPRLPSYVRVQRRQFRELSEMLRAETRPTLVTGDFNWNQFTQYHRGMGRLGFASGQEQVGSGSGNTWPVNGLLRYLPGLRLDHLYARGLAFDEFRTGGATGSDHRAVIAIVGANRR